MREKRKIERERERENGEREDAVRLAHAKRRDFERKFVRKFWGKRVKSERIRKEKIN